MNTIKGEITVPSFVRIELIIPVEIVNNCGDKIFSLLTNEGFEYEKEYRTGDHLNVIAITQSIDMEKTINFFNTSIDDYQKIINKLHEALKDLAIPHELLFYWIPLRFSENIINARNFMALQHHWMFAINGCGYALSEHYSKGNLTKPEIMSSTELRAFFDNEFSLLQKYLITSEKVRELLIQENQQTGRDLLLARNLLGDTGDEYELFS